MTAGQTDARSSDFHRMDAFRRRFSGLRLQQKIRLFNLASVFLLIIIFIGGYIFSSSSIIKRSQDSMRDGLENFNAYFRETDELISSRLEQLDSSISVYQVLISAGSGSQEKWKVDALLRDLRGIGEIDSIELYTSDGRIVAGIPDDSDASIPTEISAEVLSEICAEPGKNFWVDDTSYSNTRADGITIYRAFRTGEDENLTGIARVVVSIAALSSAYSYQVTKNMFDIYLFTSKGNILLPGDTETAVLRVSHDRFTDYIDGDKNACNDGIHSYKGQLYRTRCLSLEPYGLFAVCSVSETRLMQDIKMQQIVILLIGLVCALAQFLITANMGRLLSRPIEELSGKVLEVNAGNLDVRSDNTNSDEIGVLAGNFNAMLDHIQQLMLENVQAEKKRHELELLSLQMQITPHFLYNSLDSISALAQMGDDQGAFEMSKALSAFYRGVLSDGRNVISIREEIRMTENYLLIQSQRYRDDFTYQINIEPELMDAAIVKLTLQPLVENAIYHGIRNVRRHGLLKITGQMTQSGDILMTVWDNGKGMTEVPLSDEEPKEKGDLILRLRGFGMYNADQRIKLYFGNRYGLNVSSEPGNWTRVDVKIPWRQYEELHRDFSIDR